jgi:hypothetical protein
MRGTIGGVPICRNGIPDFATVAMGVGPFVNSFSSEFFSLLSFFLAYCTRPAYQNPLFAKSIYPFAAIFLARPV